MDTACGKRRLKYGEEALTAGHRLENIEREARKMDGKQYNDLYNEGGEGYIPSTDAEKKQIEVELDARKTAPKIGSPEWWTIQNKRQEEYLAKEKKNG